MASVKLVSPVCVCRWPRLNEPDYNFKEEGEFNVTLVISKNWDEGKAFVGQINDLGNEWQERCMKDAGGELNSFTSPVKTSRDNEDQWEVSFKMTAKGTERSSGRQWQQRPILMSAKTPDKPFDDIIGSGSHIRVAAHPYCWFNPTKGKRAGIKLQPRNVFVYRCVSPEMQQTAAEMIGLTGKETSYVIDGEKFDLTEDDGSKEVTNQEF